MSWTHFYLLYKLQITSVLVWLSEEPLESHNKLEKRYKRDHVMTNSRQSIMENLVHRSLDGSDPLVLHYSLQERLKFRDQHTFEELPQVIQDMVIKDHPYNQFR